ncbi:hypothetical protein HRbin39_00565 [bacterium HR39]|nr:hypothetical protein HRbin39_00565 [bacterium HR39]
MRKSAACALGMLLAAAAAVPTADAGTSHYVPGVEGIKAATVPPPGFYLRNYFLWYHAGRLNDAEGDRVPGDNDFDVYAVVPRLVWITDWKILGADFGMEAIFPIIYKDFDIGVAGIRDREFGLGDIYLGPVILAWHGQQWDAAAAAGAWLKTGHHAQSKAASVGQGYNSLMLTLGGTWYPDSEKKWSISALNRFEIHGERDDSDIRDGNHWVLEWGLGYQIQPGLELGLIGYQRWQVTKDSGSGAGNATDEAHAIGVQLNWFVPQLGVVLDPAIYYEYASEDQPQGWLFRFIVTKPFSIGK